MNVFFKINGKVVTPMLSGSILPGITRDSVIRLLKHWNIPVSERKISIEELYEAYEDGVLEEAFGTGTAAVISPIGELYWEGKHIYINDGKTGELRSEEHTSELQSRFDLVCRLLLEKKKKTKGRA